MGRRTSGGFVGSTMMASTPIESRPGSSSHQIRSSAHSRASADDDGSMGGVAGTGTGTGTGTGAGAGVVTRNQHQSSSTSRRSISSAQGHYRRYRSSSSGVRRRRSYEEAVSFENDLEEDMITAGNSDTHVSFSSDFP